jgi:hypothetical protein
VIRRPVPGAVEAVDAPAASGEPLASVVVRAIVAAGAQAYGWAAQTRRWAVGGLEDAWPDDAYRLRDMARVWSGVPALAARAAGARIAAWVRVHRVFLAAVLLGSLLATLGGMLVFKVAARGALHISLPAAQSVLSARPQQVGPGIVLQPQSTPTATVGLPSYMVGAWPSSSVPPGGGTVVIFVRVTNSASLRPVSGAMVTLQVQVTCAYPYRTDGLGPVATGADGIAAIPVRVSGMPGGQPVCVSATVRVGGQEYSANATFAPA